MASPHVAGAAALYLATNPGATPAQVKAVLLATREAVALPNDPDGIDEGVLNVAWPGSTTPAATGDLSPRDRAAASGDRTGAGDRDRTGASS